MFFLTFFATNTLLAQDFYFSSKSDSIIQGSNPLGLSYWSDFILVHAADTGITSDANGVSQWTNLKSNTINSLQSNNQKKPSLNIDGSINFALAGRTLTMPDIFTNGQDSAFTIFLVIETSSANNGQMRIIQYNESSQGFQFYIELNGSSDPNRSRLKLQTVDGIVLRSFTTETEVIDNNDLVLITMSVREDDFYKGWVNGTNVIDQVLNDPYDWAGGIDGRILGKNAADTCCDFSGSVYFVGIVNNAMSDTERATTELELNTYFNIY